MRTSVERMESNWQNSFSLEEAWEALRFQIDEGVDEWILEKPQSRFDEAKQVKENVNTPASPKPLPKAVEPAQVQGDMGAPRVAPAEVDFLIMESDAEIEAGLHEALSQTLRAQLHDPLRGLGRADADIVVIIDPPFREAVEKGDLLGDASTRLLRKSLQAIDVDIDASLGKEPRASMRILPISPWRMPQDRKFADHESKIFIEALEAHLRIASHRLILLSGSNLAGLDAQIKNGVLFGLPSVELVSARAMLREPLLKRVHWQRLLDLHAKMDEYLAI